jgi:hypothetical protein
MKLFTSTEFRSKFVKTYYVIRPAASGVAGEGDRGAEGAGLRRRETGV